MEPIFSTLDPPFKKFCQRLAELAAELELPTPLLPATVRTAAERAWPSIQLKLANSIGINHWFVPRELGGQGWTAEQIVDAYLAMSAACLTTTFVITQRAAAIRRIVAGDQSRWRDELLAGILAGKKSATVGISHLTTSRRHLSQPVLRATAAGDTGVYYLNGYSPWVTGACGADVLVVGAIDDDTGKQLLFAIEKTSAGVIVEPGFELMALTASQTGAVRFENVLAPASECLLAGPRDDVLSTSGHASTGSFQTSGLAIGLAGAAIEFLQQESQKRVELFPQFESLRQQQTELIAHLLSAARGEENPDYSAGQLRTDANSLVMRATQAAMVAAKGAGFVAGHPVGRWCREAMFFLVWSCPPNVAHANLCELVGLPPVGWALSDNE